MKKIIKICAGASALIAGCGMFATKPVVNVANAAELGTVSSVNTYTSTQNNFTFTSVSLPKTVNAEAKESFYIPYPTVSDSSYTVKINVKDGSNLYTHTKGETVEQGTETPFTVNEGKTGVNFSYYRNTTYKVYFTAEKDGKKYSSSVYNVNVVGVKYSYDIENISTVIPTVAGVNDKILLPTLTVLDANGDVVKENENPVVATPKVYRNNNEIKVEDEDNDVLTLEDGKYYFTAENLGTYTVSYSTEKYSVTPQEINIDVESWFDSSKVELEIGTLTLSNVDLNIEKELPTAKVSDGYHTYDGSTDVPHTTEITIFDENEAKVATLTGDEIKSYTFKTAGKYKLVYKVSSVYLNNVKEATKTIENVVVSDKTAPTIYLVEDYDITEDNWESSIVKLDDYVMPSRVGLGNKDNNTPSITIPAIYAEDKGSSYSDITLQRVVIAPNGTEIILENQKDNNKVASPSEAYNYYFTEKGTYTIEFRAIDANGKSTPKSFKVEVLASEGLSYTEDTNLSITLPTINNAIYSDEIKTVKVDSASDDEDNIIETHYYYYYGAESVFTSALEKYKLDDEDNIYDFDEFYTSFDATNKLYELNCEDNKLEIALQDYDKQNVGTNKFTVIAVAINDQGQFAVASEEVGIKNTTTDNVAPTITITNNLQEKYILGETTEVVLPIAEFSDEATDLTISAKYYIDNIENGLNEFSCYYIGNSIGGTITPSKQGTYYVVYTATDDANNSYDYVTSFNVERKVSYGIDVEYTSVIDVFGSTEINAYVYDDNGNKVDAESIRVDFKGASSPKKSGTNYTFNKAGDYTFTVIATVGEGVSAEEVKSDVMTIKVKDLEYVWTDENNLSSYVDKSSVVDEKVNIKIPTYTYGSETLPADVKVIDPNGEEVELTYVYVNGVKADATFVATEEGKYTTTFTAGDIESDPIYTYVGDNNRPTISISNKDSIPTNITYEDEDITLTISKTATLDEEASEGQQYNIYKVTVKAESKSKGEIYSRDITIKLFDINGSSAQVPLTWSDAISNSSIKLNGKSSESTSTFKWTISSKGEYELSIVATDATGRESYEETITFNVVEKSGETEKKDNKAGIVLIVVALVLLAGIICFFAFAGKSPKSKKIKPVKNEVKKDDEKDNQ